MICKDVKNYDNWFGGSPRKSTIRQVYNVITSGGKLKKARYYQTFETWTELDSKKILKDVVMYEKQGGAK